MENIKINHFISEKRKNMININNINNITESKRLSILTRSNAIKSLHKIRKGQPSLESYIQRKSYIDTHVNTILNLNKIL